jgi:6-phosphogluconolactonase (cycloisomerase 2 family)
MKLRAPLASVCGLFGLVISGLAATTASAAPSNDAIGQLYINDNTATVNTVAAFDRHADGRLTPVPGFPFATGGAGTGQGIGSQGALQMTSDGRYLLAVDAGSNQISVLRTEPDGALRPVGSPVASNGVQPVSIAISPSDSNHQNLVYVANAGHGGSNYSGFTLNRDGRLRPITGSTVALPDGSAPGDVLFNPTGTHLAGTRVSTSLIDSFNVGPDGRLTAAPDSPVPAQGIGPFGSEFRPTRSNQLFVSNAHGGPNNGTVSAFRVSRRGNLTSIGSSPYPDRQTAPCWIEITHNGRFLFTVNTAVPSISRYSIAPDGSLTLLGSTPFHDSTGLGPEDARLAPDGRTLWVVDTAADKVSGFAVSGSDLTELPSSPAPLPAGADPFGIVVN